MICKKCNQEKSEEHFSSSGFRPKAGGFVRRKTCKDCARAISRGWRQQNAERVKAYRKSQYAKTVVSAQPIQGGAHD